MALNHLKAVEAGEVTRSNVIGIRKAINAAYRRECGYSDSCTAPKLSSAQVAELQQAIRTWRPRVTGELHDSGLTLLRSPRWRKRLAPVAEIIDNLTEFSLVGFTTVRRPGPYGAIETIIPIYNASAVGWGSFDFINIPWQSGGNGPEIWGD